MGIESAGSAARVEAVVAALKAKEKWSEEDGRGLVEVFEASGLKPTAFCRRYGLKPWRTGMALQYLSSFASSFFRRSSRQSVGDGGFHHWTMASSTGQSELGKDLIATCELEAPGNNDHVRIELAKLGDDSGLVGAPLLLT